MLHKTLLFVVTTFSCQNTGASLPQPEVELTEPTWQLQAFKSSLGVRTPNDRGNSEIPEFAYPSTLSKNAFR